MTTLITRHVSHPIDLEVAARADYKVGSDLAACVHANLFLDGFEPDGYEITPLIWVRPSARSRKHLFCVEEWLHVHAVACGFQAIIHAVAKFDIDDDTTELSLEAQYYDPSPSADYESWLLLEADGEEVEEGAE